MAQTHIPPAYVPPALNPVEQLRAGRLTFRVTQLMVGLILYGLTMAMLVQSTLGLDPWDVFHQGLARHIPLSFGQVVIAVGAVVLVLWIPLWHRCPNFEALSTSEEPRGSQ